MYLKELGIKNYIVFDDINITFEKPFSCFTGETGAGKSAIFSSLLLLQGEKVSDTCFLNKEKDIEVCATLEVLKEDILIHDFLNKNEIEIEDNLYFTRRIKPTGKSVFKVCGEVINKNQAEELFLLLFSFCNQKSSNDIFDSSYILSGVDNYGNLKELSEEVKEKRCELNLLKKEIEKLKTEIENQKGNEDYYNYAISEIERVDLKLNEDEEIKDKIKLLKNAEQTFNIFENIKDIANSVDNNLSDLYKECKKSLNYSDILKNESEILDEKITDIQDVINEVFKKVNSIQLPKENIDDLYERLDKITKLKKKYGGTIEAVLKKYEDMKNLSSGSDIKQNELNSKTKLCKKAEEDFTLKNSELYKKRRLVADKLENKIEEVLHTLDLKHAIFKIEITNEEDVQKAKLMFSSSNALSLTEVSKGISGGEASRVNLAIKSILTNDKKIEVFDEADAALGGHAALVVADRFKAISSKNQILVITHLAQVAVKAEEHFSVIKSINNKTVRSNIIKLKGKEREKEVARLLTGQMDEKNVLALAKEMLK